MNASLNYRERLGQISSALFKIHKLLLEDEFENREKSTGNPIPPTERLNILLNDPSVAWLRILSGLMAYVDEIYYQKEAILERQFEDVLDKTSHLIALQDEQEFTYRYRQALGTIPDLMVAHGHLKAALKQPRESQN